MLVDRFSSPMTLVWLIYFSFAELLSLMPSRAPSCILISEEANSENYSGDYACASMHEAIFRFARYIWENASHDNIIAFGTILVAIFTYVLYRSTNKLWDAGERQLVHLRESAERQFGAYIGIEWCRVTSNDWGATFMVEVQIKNAGQTPAYDVSHRIAAALQIMHDRQLDFVMPDRSPGIIPIAPGMTFTLATPIAIGGPSGVSTIGIGRTIFAWGRVDYEDVFDKPQHLEFRFRSGEAIRQHNGTNMQTVGWKMDAEDDGNTAT
jgi:hypothetical protein